MSKSLFRRLRCWLGDLLKKDWHNWEILSEQASEYEPELLYKQERCQNCGKFMYGTYYCKKDKKDD